MGFERLMGGIRALLLVGVLADGGAVFAQEPAPRSPQNAEFHRALDVWRASGQKLREAKEALPDPERPDERVAAIEAAVRDSNEKLNDLWAAALAAYRVDPNDKEVAEFVPFMAGRLAAVDRLEPALEGALAVAEHGTKDAELYGLIVRSAIDIGDVETARKYLRVAVDEKLFPLEDPEAFAKLDRLAELWKSEEARREAEAKADNNPRVKIRTTQGDIVVELYEDDVPNTVANFLYLIQERFYDNLPFFRVVSGFGATAGCPLGDGSTGPGYEITREGTDKPRLLTRGTISMVSTQKAIHGSHFFLNYRLANAESLGEKLLVFGRIVEGLDVACQLQRVDPRVASSDAPPDRILETIVLRKRERDYFPETTAGLALAQVQAALDLSAKGQVPEAIKLLEDNLKLAPDQFETNYALGLIHMALNHSMDATRYLRKAVIARPNQSDAHFRLGVLLTNQRKNDDAIQEFRDCIRFNPQDARAYNNLATLLSQRGQIEEAIRLLQKAVELAPDYLAAQDNLARLRARESELQARKRGKSPPPATPPGQAEGKERTTGE